jgi:hypothetical protein
MKTLTAASFLVLSLSLLGSTFNVAQAASTDKDSQRCSCADGPDTTHLDSDGTLHTMDSGF